MEYSYSACEKKNNNTAFNCLLATHTLNAIVSLFVSTFLIAHIYSFNGDTYSYLFNVAIFNITYYLGYACLYIPISKIVDRTNRVVMYRIGIVVKTLLVISFIFFGKSLAKLLVLAGVMNALGDSLYYSSFNVLRQEMVSRKQSGNFASVYYILAKIVEVVCPVILGMLIDSITYSCTAVVVLAVCVAQIVISVFVKSKRPEGSKYNLTEYIRILKSKKGVNKKISYMYVISAVYGVSYLLTALMNVCVMLEYGTNLSLGFITSVFSLGAIFVIILMSRFTKAGKRSWLFIVCGLLPVIASVIFAININKFTLVLLNGLYLLTAIVFRVLFDEHRNSTLKEAGLYNEISEHHSIIEVCAGISRGVCFALMLGVALIRNIALLKVMVVVTTFMCMMIHMLILVYEKKYLKIKE